MRKCIVIFFSLAAAVGCSSNPAARPDVSVPSPRNALDASTVSTPLDAYLPPSGLTLRLHRAEALLTNRCLTHLGYVDHPMPVPREVSARRKHSEFLVFSASQARKFGYNAPDGRVGSGDSGWDKKAPEVQRGLLDGSLKKYKGTTVPRGGCVGVAADRLTRNSRVPKKIEGGGIELKQLQKTSPTSLGDAQIGIMRLDAISATKRDRRYLELISFWSACMSKKGYRYKTPESALDDRRWSGSVPSEIEKGTAVADMACKQTVDYLAVASRVQSSYEARVIDERREELAELRRNLKAWKQNADRAIADVSG